MAAREPLSAVKLISASHAEDAAYGALQDVAHLLGVLKISDARLIGGHMVSLHVARWALGQELYRETVDADLGIAKLALGAAKMVGELTKLGYRKTAGDRFERAASTPRGAATIDILVQSTRTRARQNIKIGDLRVTEAPGLAYVLGVPATNVDLTLTRQNGVSWSGDMPIPDEVGSLLLKVHAWAARRADKDAVDVWRCLEVAYAASVRLPSRGADLDYGRKILLTDFGARTGAGILAMVRSSNLSAAVGRQRATRVAALVRRVLG